MDQDCKGNVWCLTNEPKLLVFDKELNIIAEFCNINVSFGKLNYPAVTARTFKFCCNRNTLYWILPNGELQTIDSTRLEKQKTFPLLISFGNRTQ